MFGTVVLWLACQADIQHEYAAMLDACRERESVSRSRHLEFFTLWFSGDRVVAANAVDLHFSGSNEKWLHRHEEIETGSPESRCEYWNHERAWEKFGELQDTVRPIIRVLTQDQTLGLDPFRGRPRLWWGQRRSHHDHSWVRSTATAGLATGLVQSERWLSTELERREPVDAEISGQHSSVLLKTTPSSSSCLRVSCDRQQSYLPITLERWSQSPGKGLEKSDLGRLVFRVSVLASEKQCGVWFPTESRLQSSYGLGETRAWSRIAKDANPTTFDAEGLPLEIAAVHGAALVMDDQGSDWVEMGDPTLCEETLSAMQECGGLRDESAESFKDTQPPSR